MLDYSQQAVTKTLTPLLVDKVEPQQYGNAAAKYTQSSVHKALK